MTLLEKLGTKLQEKQIEEVKLQKALEQKALQKQLAEQRQQEEAEAIEKVSSLQTEINRLQGIANTLSNKHGLKLDYLTSLEALRGSKAEFKQADQEFENLIWQAANPDYKTKDDILKDKDLSNEEEVVIWKEKEMGLMQKVGERQGKKEALTQSEAKTSTVSLKAELKELIPDEKFSFTKDKAQESLDKITQVLQQKTAELLKYEKKTPEYKEKLKARHKEYPTNVSVQDLQDAKIAEKGGEELIKGLIVENAKDMMQKEARQTNFGKVEAELQKINKSMEAWPQAKKSIEDLAKRGDKVFAEILELIPKPSRDRLEESRKVDPDLLHFFNAH
ncbi:MAG: hypothetical protein NTV62_00900 [Candidatus Gribaldobacteria bacterium]|nr:hypothetical protein [Candidatus Gribaldobacteria bacterium]